MRSKLSSYVCWEQLHRTAISSSSSSFPADLRAKRPSSSSSRTGERRSYVHPRASSHRRPSLMHIPGAHPMGTSLQLRPIPRSATPPQNKKTQPPRHRAHRNAAACGLPRHASPSLPGPLRVARPRARGARAPPHSQRRVVTLPGQPALLSAEHGACAQPPPARSAPALA